MATEIQEIFVSQSLFDFYFEEFKGFVEEKSNEKFESFASNAYTYEHEGYKDKVYHVAREALACQTWQKKDIGTGRIIDAVIASLGAKENNLVNWRSRDDILKHWKDSKQHPEQCKKAETVLFNLYLNNDDENTFSQLVELVGRRYGFIAYLFFIKNPSRYLPISVRRFDKTFVKLEVALETSGQCSWENYTKYLQAVEIVRSLLVSKLNIVVPLLDAHSFLWILAGEMEEEQRFFSAPVSVQEKAGQERYYEAMTKVRKDQRAFRKRVIDYWQACSVTGCTEHALLEAAHIKPFSEYGSESPILDEFNGLLLTPNLHKCFDQGLISFDDDGKILMADNLTNGDMNALNIYGDMKLSKVESRHKGYLAYHRKRHNFEASEATLPDQA